MNRRRTEFEADLHDSFNLSSNLKKSYPPFQQIGRNTMRTLHTLAFAVSAAVLLSACSSTPPAPVKTDTPTPQPQQQAKTDNRTVETAVATIDPLDDPKGILAQRSVYFDFDKYEIKQEFNPLVTAHSNYLESHKARKILIQGNTDERGGSEYNLALGQKRAEAVLSSMKVMGVATEQMEAVSLGKEKPKAAGHDEAAWSQNRRADILYTAAK
jgi:peptidoglycan-associated lipoprotein